MGNARTLFEKARGTRIRGRFHSTNANAEQKGFNSKVQETHNDLNLFVTVQLLEDTPALSFGKLCEEHGYTYEWTSGQKPHQTKDGKNISMQD